VSSFTNIKILSYTQSNINLNSGGTYIMKSMTDLFRFPYSFRLDILKSHRRSIGLRRHTAQQYR